MFVHVFGSSFYLDILIYSLIHNKHFSLLYPYSSTMIYMLSVCEEEFEDTKGVIRIRKSMKERQHNGQKKKYKRTNNGLQNIHIKLEINRYLDPFRCYF
jgi:hypothetical protein